jgi:glycosyltransferase involved in cell wall biosynthesis
MSVYNGEKWLAVAIESILKQSFSDFEFIIVNDGSTDESLSVIQTYAAGDDRILVLNKSNSGLTKSLNLGASRAKGDWIARIDADDIAHKDRLAFQLNAVRKNSELKLLGTGHQLIDNEGVKGASYSLPNDHRILKKRLLMKQGFFAHSSAFFSRDLFEKISGYRELFRRAQDYDLWLRFAEHGAIGSLPEILLSVRKHNEQISHSEGGSLQMVDSRIALYSYLHRVKNINDPINEIESEEQFDQFRQVFKRELTARRLFDLFDLKSKVKASLMNKEYGRLLTLLTRLITHDRELAYRAARSYFSGESIVAEIFADNSGKNLLL